MHMPFFPVGLLAGDGCCSLGCSLVPLWTSEVALMEGTCLPMQETQETQVRSQGCKDPLEEEMATHSSTLA